MSILCSHKKAYGSQHATNNFGETAKSPSSSPIWSSHWIVPPPPAAGSLSKQTLDEYHQRVRELAMAPRRQIIVDGHEWQPPPPPPLPTQ